MSDLPRDVLIDILSRLPVRPLGQFKSVCKSWFSLISSPDFVKLHHRRVISDPNTNHSRVFVRSTHSLRSVDYESPSCYEGVDDDAKSIVSLENPLIKEEVDDELMGSCYGLVFFVCYEECIVLWNPCTQQTRRIPNPSTLFSDAELFYGLGYDSSVDDYKMVRVRATRSISGNLTRAEVFNLKSESWRTIQAFHNDINISGDEVGTFSNGALHWEGTRGNGPNEHNIILSLDTTEENFKEIPLPNVGDHERIIFSCLGDSNGCLYMVYGGIATDVDIWVMKEYGVQNSWTKLIKLSWDAFDCCYTLLPVYITKEDDVVVNLDAWHLVRFNLSEKTIKNFKKVSTDWHECLMFTECLVSPFG